MPKAPAKKTDFNLMIVHFYISRKLDIHNFSEWLRTSSNPPDINRFPSDIEIFLPEKIIFQFHEDIPS